VSEVQPPGPVRVLDDEERGREMKEGVWDMKSARKRGRAGHLGFSRVFGHLE
jgi:hypothetical protein